jgi:hypothetical protein
MASNVSNLILFTNLFKYLVLLDELFQEKQCIVKETILYRAGESFAVRKKHAVMVLISDTPMVELFLSDSVRDTTHRCARSCFFLCKKDNVCSS